jgi:hypothetical protein
MNLSFSCTKTPAIIHSIIEHLKRPVWQRLAGSGHNRLKKSNLKFIIWHDNCIVNSNYSGQEYYKPEYFMNLIHIT